MRIITLRNHLLRRLPFRSGWNVGFGFVAFAAALSGCTDDVVVPLDTENETEEIETEAETDTETETNRAGGSDELENGWREIFPEGDTICSRGAPFSFFVRPGTIDKVVVDFMGGGACWDAESCAPGSELFVDTVDPFRDWINGGNPFGMGAPDGIYDHANEDNPFKDWHHVVIPYCTADVHWGDASRDFGDLHIEFRGAVNTRAVLNWLYGNIEAPEQIFVTGCSAGSPGSALWFAHIAEHYKDSKVAQFGDSFAGIVTEEFFENEFPLWNAEAAYPDWILNFDPMSLTDIYIDIADYYPSLFMSQFNSPGDGAQPYYYMAMGGDSPEEWPAAMRDSLFTIEAGADNFASFVPNGNYHCILPRKEFYTIQAGGTALLDWINAILKDGSTESAMD